MEYEPKIKCQISFQQEGFYPLYVKKVLPIPGLSSITELCLKYNALERPNTEDLFMSLKNLLV